jgi:hypothetical protein
MKGSRNLTLKNYYQIKTNREMLQHDFQFFENLMIFSQKKKVIEYSLFILIFFTFEQKFKPKKKKKKKFSLHVYLNVFNHIVTF